MSIVDILKESPLRSKFIVNKNLENLDDVKGDIIVLIENDRVHDRFIFKCPDNITWTMKVDWLLKNEDLLIPLDDPNNVENFLL